MLHLWHTQHLSLSYWNSAQLCMRCLCMRCVSQSLSSENPNYNSHPHTYMLHFLCLGSLCLFYFLARTYPELMNPSRLGSVTLDVDSWVPADPVAFCENVLHTPLFLYQLLESHSHLHSACGTTRKGAEEMNEPKIK